jgi:hypothetical protein
MEDPNSLPVINSNKLVEISFTIMGKAPPENIFLPDGLIVYQRYSSDICNVASLIRQEKFSEALNAIEMLDSIPRAEIPDDVYQYVSSQIN